MKSKRDNGYHLLQMMCNSNSLCLTLTTKWLSSKKIQAPQHIPTNLKPHGDLVFSDSKSTLKDMDLHILTIEWKCL